MTSKVPDPVSEFLELKTKLAVNKTQEDLRLWHAWDQGGRTPDLLQPLIQRYEPLLKRKQTEWGQGVRAVSPVAFHAELQKHFIQAAQSFEPERGVVFNTHVQTRLKKAQRFRNKYQNVGYIPEEQASHIGPLLRAQEELHSQFGREPSHSELATHLGMPERKITTLLKSMRKDVLSSSFEDDPFGTNTSRESDVIRIMQGRPHEYLTPIEASVFNHVYGVNGHKKITDTTGLAAQLGLSQPKVSRIKTSIGNKIKSNM